MTNDARNKIIDICLEYAWSNPEDSDPVWRALAGEGDPQDPSSTSIAPNQSPVTIFREDMRP